MLSPVTQSSTSAPRAATRHGTATAGRKLPSFGAAATRLAADSSGPTVKLYCGRKIRDRVEPSV